MAQSDAEIKAAKEKSTRESVEITRRMLLAWRDRIRLDDIEAAAVVIQRATEEIIHTVLFSDVPVSRKRLIDQLIDMQFHYLVKPLKQSGLKKTRSSRRG